jgi:Kef-type K+ transport system membrane component KefB/mannitol/fructose-specific phosphotransferase system IIA component (Ntr-type)
VGARLLESDIVVLFLSLGVLLVTARVFGELARRLGQPSVVGELIAGVLLGPTVLGVILPELSAYLFPREGNVAIAMKGFLAIAIALFLLVAGMEVDLSSVWRQGRVAMTVSIAGIVVPFGIGLSAAYVAPQLMGREPDANQLIFALFLGTALAISALPVIAKTLMDLNIYRTDLGMLVIASAVLNDLAGWLVFALILGMIGASGHAMPLRYTILLTLGFAGFVLTAGRWLVNRSLPWIQAHTSWPGGVLSVALSLGLIGGAFTEWIGVHAILGAFLVGVAFGDSPHLREQTRTIIHQFISFIFAPLFFASVGLTLNFVEHFRWQTTLLVLIIACAGKILGCGLGARLAGVEPREAWAIGFAMNARGAMEIILGLLALQSGVIRERMFVALVIMALVTSVMSGPAMRRLLHLKNPRRLDQFLSPRSFIPKLAAVTATGAIQELAGAMASGGGLDEQAVAGAVLEREEQSSTGIGEGVAIPHARLAEIKHPIVGIGISHAGIDFNATDGEPANLIFLLLTPIEDDGAQIEILSDLARKFGNDATRQAAMRTNSFTEFLAVLRTHTARPPV